MVLCEPPLLKPINPGEELDMSELPRMMTISQAQDLMEAHNLPRPPNLTLINWIEKYDLGWKMGGRWVLDEHKFHAFLLGECDKKGGSDA